MHPLPHHNLPLDPIGTVPAFHYRPAAAFTPVDGRPVTSVVAEFTAGNQLEHVGGQRYFPEVPLVSRSICIDTHAESNSRGQKS